MNTINYIPKNILIAIHDEMVIKISGGLPGTKDVGQIESVLTHIQNDSYYPSFEEKITHLIFSLVNFHMFNDGNKRTGIAASVYFLRINGLDYVTNTFLVEMENIVVWVASGYIDKDFLFEIVSDLIHYEYLSEETKIKLVSVLSKEK